MPGTVGTLQNAVAPRPAEPAQPTFLLASASGPSREQRAAVCRDVLREAVQLSQEISDIVHPIVMNGGRLDQQPPATRQVLGEKIDEMLEKIEFLKNQCGDVLNAQQRGWLGDVERRMNGLKGALAGDRSNFDLADAARFLGDVVTGLAALLLGIGGWLLRPGPGGALQRM